MIEILLFPLIVMVGSLPALFFERPANATGGGGPGAGVDNILLTTGDDLLLVDGTSVLLRAG